MTPSSSKFREVIYPESYKPLPEGYKVMRSRQRGHKTIEVYADFEGERIYTSNDIFDARRYAFRHTEKKNDSR